MPEMLLQTDTYVSLLTLTLLEIVLGIDNVIFIAILTDRLPRADRPRIRRIGLVLALGSRLALLFAISWVMGLTEPLFQLFGVDFSGRSLILLGGGLFLIAKASHEIYDKLEVDHAREANSGSASVALMLVQIVLLDIVFSLDSVITAVGMAKHVEVMVVAMVLAVGVMLWSANGIGDFVNRHPSMKVLALSFLLLIGVMLTAEGTGQHVSKGYIYTAMVFSLAVELLNMRLRKRQRPVTLHHRFEGEAPPG